MTKEDLVSVLIITMNCFWLGTWLDQKFLLRKRFLNKSYQEAVNGRCPVCERPIKIINDTGSEPAARRCPHGKDMVNCIDCIKE